MPRNTAQQLYDVGYVVYGGERDGWRTRRERKKEVQKNRRGGVKEIHEKGQVERVQIMDCEKDKKRKVMGRIDHRGKGQGGRRERERGRKKETVTESKGEKPVSELCLHSRGDEMKMINCRVKSDVHSNMEISDPDPETLFSIRPQCQEVKGVSQFHDISVRSFLLVQHMQSEVKCVSCMQSGQ